MSKKIIYSSILVLLAIALVLFLIICNFQNRELRIIFLNVGQGDAILIEQGSSQILIDGGPDGQKTLEKLGEYVPFWDRTIEIVIATHPDQDHIDGLIDVMKNYHVGKIIDNADDSSSQVYKKYLETIEEKNISRVKGERGMNIKIGDQAAINILSPENISANLKDNNINSLVGKLAFGGNSFLLTGDLPDEKEKELMAQEIDISARVLKVAHHGSKYATSGAFLEQVNPADAIISVGKNNRYGHPAPELLERLENHGVRILRTDEAGDIGYICRDAHSLCVMEIR